jgi:hypothetical protein
MSSLSIILVNRLVLNLRERAVNKLPTTFETTESFHVALPPTFVRRNRPTVTATTTFETVASVPAGQSPSQQLRSMDAYILSLSSVKQNRSIGETVSVRISTEILQTAGDETRYVPPLVESPAGSSVAEKKSWHPLSPIFVETHSNHQVRRAFALGPSVSLIREGAHQPSLIPIQTRGLTPTRML